MKEYQAWLIISALFMLIGNTEKNEARGAAAYLIATIFMIVTILSKLLD